MTELSIGSHESRIAGGRKGGLATAANQSPTQRFLGAQKASAAKYAKYSHEELSEKYAGFLTRRFATMTPEQASEAQRNAARKRMASLTPEERSSLARKAIQTRHARIAYAKNPKPADQVLAYLREFISTHGYSPKLKELAKATHHDHNTMPKLLRMLEATGQIRRGDWQRGITLNGSPAKIPVSTVGQPEQDQAPVIVARSTRKCYDCDAPAVEGKTKCAAHWLKAKEASAKLYAVRIAASLCVNCGCPALPGTTRCEEHMVAQREAVERYRRQRREPRV